MRAAFAGRPARSMLPYETPFSNSGTTSSKDNSIPATRSDKKTELMGVNKATQRILAVQFVVTLSAVLIAAVFGDAKTVRSAGAGGGIGFAVTACFAFLVFRVRPGAAAGKMARALFLGEAVKFVLTVLLFAAALLFMDLAFMPFILTYAVTLAAYWLALPLTLDASVKML